MSWNVGIGNPSLNNAQTFLVGPLNVIKENHDWTRRRSNGPDEDLQGKMDKVIHFFAVHFKMKHWRHISGKVRKVRHLCSEYLTCWSQSALYGRTNFQEHSCVVSLLQLKTVVIERAKNLRDWCLRRLPVEFDRYYFAVSFGKRFGKCIDQSRLLFQGGHKTKEKEQNIDLGILARRSKEDGRVSRGYTNKQITVKQ